MERLRLLTFGGLTLLVGGESVTGATTRRRRLALLALLAVARDRGLNRDKIHAYLWPERSEEQARHGLNQLLYFQRRHLGDEDLFLGKKTPRLNPAVITCDLWEFEDALEAGTPEVAVQLYTGPFLDGFFLRGAPGFERWADDQRRRFAQQCGAALGALATAASGSGDHLRAVEWWNRAAELNPFDTDAVLCLAEALVAMGDRAAAVRHAQHHQELLRTELGLAPDPRLVQLVNQMRGS